MALSSAPGKVYLFGEHAVVYGEPAVPCAIEQRARVGVERRDDEKIRVEAEDLSLDGFTVEYGGRTEDEPDIDVSESLLAAATGYVDEAISQVRSVTGEEDVGFDVTIESDIPLGAGLGSSAAVAVAAIDAGTRELGTTLEAEEIADRAFRTEYEVQDGQASRADTFCSATGGAVRVEGDDCRTIDAPDLPIVIGFDGGAGDTGKLVSAVRDLRAEYEFASNTVDSIGNIVRNGEQALENGDVEELGRLMNFNHGLLSALGVSSRSLDAMVWAARDADAYGAKLTGSGGGGCIVALDPTEATETALKFTPGCEDAFRAELADEGVCRLE
ncbi:mevalonate kinase [Halostagnicola larsenii XH-48]|uniref:Mevalonate kinase n=1 Tax=Halostagnicola larsenii XH-48 TaxID=797299 RepID=W0JM93_9EURY|nr:mevalonate kinase [Halostagnicola larsenii]AHF99718.1 mevalonate kinase [Halostagnicola larsenii XH-48]